MSHMIVFHDQKLAVFAAPFVSTSAFEKDCQEAGAVFEPLAFLKYVPSLQEAEPEYDGDGNLIPVDTSKDYEMFCVVENPYVRLCRMYDTLSHSLKETGSPRPSWNWFVEQALLGDEGGLDTYMYARICDYLGNTPVEFKQIRADEVYTELPVEKISEDVIRPARNYGKYVLGPQVRKWCMPDTSRFGYVGQLQKNLPEN